MKLGCILFVTLLCACSSIDNTQSNTDIEMDIPNSWGGGSAQSSFQEGVASTVEWGVVLPASIQAMLDNALSNNQQLRIASLKMQQGLLDVKASSGLSWPELKLLMAHRQSQSLNSNLVKSSNTVSSLGINATWEIDLWRRLADGTDSVSWTLAAKEQELEAVKLSVMAQVITGWLNVIEQNNLLALNKKNIANQKRRLQMSMLRLDNGLATSIDIRNAKTSYKRLTDTEQVIQFRRDQALRKLQLVLGAYPSAQMIDDLTLPKVVDLNVNTSPKDILLNRPDVLAAESTLIASGFSWNAAEKKKLPRLSLTLNYDVKRDSISELFDFDYWLNAVTASLVQPIFYRGMLSAQAEKAKLQRDIQLAHYKSTLLTAWQEVENTLQNDTVLKERQILLNQALYQAQYAEQQTENQYTQGLATSFELLSAQRTRTSVETDAVKIAIARVKNRIQLTLALGLPSQLNTN